jgi:phenylalanyl-tRNA synthetase beta chain
MANVKFPRKEFEKYIKITKEVEEKISMFGTPLEKLDEDEIEIEIFPNRPDLLSMHGFLRGFLAFLGKKTGLKEYKIYKPEKDYEVQVDKSVLEVRPYTACAIVKDIKFDNEKIKEVIEIQEKLHNTLGRNRKKIAIGIYPLEKIKLPIRYEARNPNEIKFVPLEARAEMNGKQILSGHPTGREYAHLLANKKQFPVFVDANNEILSMPPIINSHKTGKVENNTREIFIECSGFDLEILKKTLNILITMFADLGGKVYQMKVKHPKGKYTTPDLTPEKMKISLENTNKLLGLDLRMRDVEKNLEKMGYNIRKSEVSIPAWRVDVLHENDLIEDVAIAYGYDNLVPQIPNISFTGKEDPKEIAKRKISEILQGLNMLEISNYHLTTINDQFKKMSKKKEAMIEVQDSKTDYTILRQNLLHYALKILRENSDSEYPQRLFEIGRVFDFANSREDTSKKLLGVLDTGIKETENLCIAIADPKTGFTEIKQILDYLMRMLDLGDKYQLEPAEQHSFITGRCAKVIVDKKEIGYIGEIEPKILNNQKISTPVSALELGLDNLI